MTPSLRSAWFSLGPCALLLAAGCLPTDTRDPPGELIVSASPDEALTQGFMTDDGWSISYTRYLVVLGGVLTFADDCYLYSQGDYSRILDMFQPSPQRLSVFYGLGPCTFSFRIHQPGWNTIRGSGVSEADETFLRTAQDDGHTEGQGISVHMEGVAMSATGRKNFSWSFRPFIEYQDCFVAPDATPKTGVTLRGEQQTLVEIRVRGTALFQQAPEEPVGALRFDPFREADDAYGDADGTITLDELDRAPLPPELTPNPPILTLGDRVYLELLRDIARFQATGTCRAQVHTRPPGFEL